MYVFCKYTERAIFANTMPKCKYRKGIPSEVLITIDYLKCRADLNFEVDFVSNSTIGTVATLWDLTLFGK